MQYASCFEVVPPAESESRAPQPRRSDAHESGTSERLADNRPRVLWIDDQVADEDPSVHMLRCDGIAVECAASVGEALRLVRAARFDGLVLDLNLPDGSGLDLLQTLRAEGVSTPVLVVTGFGDSESALTAGRLGVIGFKHKPVMADEWIDSVRALIEAGRRSESSQFASGYRSVPAKNLSALEGRGGADLPAYLARTLADPALDIIAFVALAELLRQTVLTPVRTGSISLADEADRAIQRLSLQLRYAVRSQGLAALEVLSRALSRHRRPSATDVARDLGIDPGVFEGDLEVETGRPFAEWRSAIAIMLAVRELATSFEQVSQIAYGLGFNHSSQFDREFRRLLGVTPRTLRTLLKRTRLHGGD
jgi:FixJ family two-component response regulator/AraC-like DNA-binding protein